jgi:hypothetical protein
MIVGYLVGTPETQLLQTIMQVPVKLGNFLAKCLHKLFLVFESILDITHW